MDLPTKYLKYVSDKDATSLPNFLKYQVLNEGALTQLLGQYHSL